MSFQTREEATYKMGWDNTVVSKGGSERERERVSYFAERVYDTVLFGP